MSILEKINEWSEKKIRNNILKKYGGVQQCTYCSSMIQRKGDWSIRQWERDSMLDVITCGTCGGQSLFRFEMGMIFIGPLSPPKSKFEPVDYYDIEKAKLKHL